VAACVEYEISTVGDSEAHALEAIELHLEDISRDALEDIGNKVGSEPVVRTFKVSAPAILQR
jgi:hypothetical protein